MVLKHGIAGCLALGFAATALAQNKSEKMVDIEAKIRTDLIQSKKKVGSKDEESIAEGWKIHNVDVNISGTLNGGKTGYSLKLRPLQIGKIASGEKPDIDGTTSVVIEAYVLYRLFPMLEAKFGKLVALAGSVEFDYSYFDQYFYSHHAYLPWVFHTGTGAELAFMPLGNNDHILKLQVINGHKGEQTEPKGGMDTAVAYYGNIAGGMIRPIVTYSMQRYTAGKDTTKLPSGAAGEKKYDSTAASALGVGAQFNVADLIVDAEYNQVSVGKAKLRDASGAEVGEQKAQAYQGFIFQLKYNVESLGLAPWVKATTESHKLGADEGAGDISYMLTAAGVEWSPEKSIRFHVAYGNAAKNEKKKGDGSNGADKGSDLKTTETTLMAGVGVKI